MPDISAPMTFKPSKTTDHIQFRLSGLITIGLEEYDDESFKNFITILKSRIETTGAVINEIDARVSKADFFCGSPREKLLANEQESYREEI